MTPVLKRVLLLGLLLALGAAIAYLGTRSESGATRTAATSGDALALQWADLLPPATAAYRPAPTDPFANLTTPEQSAFASDRSQDGPRMSVAARTGADAPRADLDGKRIVLAGYMTPINVVGGETNTFLLVPYVGACIHVPAPPPNQIVLVESAEPIEVRPMWDPFKAVGRLRVENVDAGLAEVGYVMELDRIDPYDDGDDEKLEGVRSINDGD